MLCDGCCMSSWEFEMAMDGYVLDWYLRKDASSVLDESCRRFRNRDNDSDD